MGRVLAGAGPDRLALGGLRGSRPAVFPGLPAAAFAAGPLLASSFETISGLLYLAAGLGGVIFMSLVTLLLPLVTAAATATQLPRMRRTGVLDGLRVTPLAVERLPDALVRSQLRRRLGFLAAAVPLYLLALNWAEWLRLLRLLGMHGGGNPVLLTGPYFFLDPSNWLEAVSDYSQLSGSMLFGAILLVSDLLMCWRAAALGAWLGARFRNGALAAALATVGATAMWGLRLLFFALAFGFQQHLVGPYERAVAAFAADVPAFALVAPFCLGRARAALTKGTQGRVADSPHRQEQLRRAASDHCPRAGDTAGVGEVSTG